MHTFTNEQLDRLIQVISLSDMFSLEEKTELIRRIKGTASAYYKSPFWDGGELRFHPKAIHGRFTSRNQEERNRHVENLKVIQQAINQMAKIQFTFNRYTEEHTLVLKQKITHVLSPYHLVVYHDNYYCIGLKEENHDKRIWHYRVDLMSDVSIVKKDGEMERIEVSAFEGLPICNAYWDPEKYMAEHLNMGYDQPREVLIRVKPMDYTMLHDWFGEHYEKVSEAVIDGKRFDTVKIISSPEMLVHWAMQYGAAVEILDHEIRERIRDELKKMQEKYNGEF